jgi:hypothetical protein
MCLKLTWLKIQVFPSFEGEHNYALCYLWTAYGVHAAARSLLLFLTVDGSVLLYAVCDIRNRTPTLCVTAVHVLKRDATESMTRKGLPHPDCEIFRCGKIYYCNKAKPLKTVIFWDVAFVNFRGHFRRAYWPQDGARGSVVVKALCYKPEGRGSETRWGEFLNLPNLSGRIRPWGSLSL